MVPVKVRNVKYVLIDSYLPVEKQWFCSHIRQRPRNNLAPTLGSTAHTVSEGVPLGQVKWQGVVRAHIPCNTGPFIDDK